MLTPIPPRAGWVSLLRHLPMKHFLKTTGVIIGMLCAGLPSGAILAQTALETRQVALSQNLKPGDRVGRLRFLGMLELSEVTRDSRRLSQLSGLAWDDDDGILYALSDKGTLFHLQPLFEGDILTGVKLLQSLPLRELGSDKPLRGWRIDAEGLDIVNGRNGRRDDAELIIGKERRAADHALSSGRLRHRHSMPCRHRSDKRRIVFRSEQDAGGRLRRTPRSASWPCPKCHSKTNARDTPGFSA